MTRDLVRIQRSMFNVDDLTRLVQAYYGFERGVHCRLVKSMLADTYTVWADNHRYLLKVYRYQSQTASEIEASVRLLTYLHEMGVPVPLPVNKRGGSAILRLEAPEGERYAVLFRYLEGVPLNHHDPTPNIINAFGEMLARLHRTFDKLTLTFDRPIIDTERLLREPVRSLKTAGLLSHRARDLAYVHRVTSVLRTNIIKMPTVKPGFGLIHGDIDTSNVIVMDDGRIGLIDFDYAGEGYRAYDLAAFQSDAHLRKMPEGLADSFLESYSKVRPITDDEWRAVPMLRAARAVWAMGLYAQNVNEWGSLRFSDALVDRQLDDIRAAMVEFQIG